MPTLSQLFSFFLKKATTPLRMRNIEALSQKIFYYAQEVNTHCNGIKYYADKDEEQVEIASEFFSAAVSDLYNFVYQNSGKLLIKCETKYLKEIGLAYIKIANYYQASSQYWYVNSVSAENAYYCLVRYYKETGDNSPLPFLFLILEENNGLFDDKFAESWKSLNPRLTRLPFGGGLSVDVALSACVRYYYIYVQRYILSKFYDFSNEKILIKDKILELYYPNFADIIYDFNEEYTHYDTNEYASNREQLGEIYFNQLYKQCEATLMKF